MTTLLPPNADPAERILEEVLARTDGIPVPIADIKRAQVTDPRVLPALGWEFSVNEWQSAWPVQRRRDVVDTSPAIHRKLGVTATVRQAIAALGYTVVMQEWFQYAGDPYCFRIAFAFEQEEMRISDYLAIQRTALDAKNVRSFFEGFSATRTQPGRVSYGIGHAGLVAREFQPPEPPIYEFRSLIGAGIGQAPHLIFTVFDPYEDEE